MRTDGYFDSCGAGKIHYCRWTPEGEPKAVLQIIHGIAEFVERYDGFARYLNSLGYLVVAEDHMGHGKSINGAGVRGYFHGGWFSAVEDSMLLMKLTKEEFPDLPYVLFGHSMGSFMARTILCKYPDCGLTAAVICGTGWQPRAILPGGIEICKLICKKSGEQNPSEKLDKMIFGGYNKKVEHPRTRFDWLSRDQKNVDDYIAHPLCGFVASAGLMRELMIGIRYVEDPQNLANMGKALPVFFIAGGDDPVGNYGKGVRQAEEAFRKAGMEKVDCRIYPLCRHEILNEINKEEIYEDVAQWLAPMVKNQ